MTTIAAPPIIARMSVVQPLHRFTRSLRGRLLRWSAVRWSVHQTVAAVAVVSLLGCEFTGNIIGSGSESESGSDPNHAGTGGTANVPPGYAEIAPIRRLTNFEFENTVRDLLPMVSVDLSNALPDDHVSRGFDNNAEHADITELRTRRMLDLAEQIAEDVSGRLGDLLPCTVDTLDETCAETFVRSFGQRAYRRPLTEDEAQILMDQYHALSAQSNQERLQALLMSFLMAPQFHFRPEFGDPEVAAPQGQRALTGYEIASRLSYFLWGTMPDTELLAAAEAGELATVEGIETQALRLLGSPRAGDAVGHFGLQLIHAHELSSLTKDPGLFPQWSSELVADLEKEARLFFERLVLETDNGFSELMTGNVSYVNSRVAELYGIDTSGLDPQTWQPRELPETQRAGVLTLPAFLAVAAQPDYPSIVKRGLFVRQQLLCQRIPAPPAGAADSSVIIAPGSSNRERRIAHANSGDVCASCHNAIDPPGFALENYNAIGGYQTTELTLEGNPIPIDASGELINTDVDGSFSNALELAARLHESRTVQECLTRQWFRYGLGRTETPSEGPIIVELTETLDQAGGDFKDLIIAVVTHDAFRYRPDGDLP